MVEFLDNQMKELNLNNSSNPNMFKVENTDVETEVDSMDTVNTMMNNADNIPSSDTIAGGEGTDVLIGAGGTKWPKPNPKRIEDILTPLQKRNAKQTADIYKRKSILDREGVNVFQEAKQLAKISAASVVEGIKTSTYDFALVSAELRDMVSNGVGMVGDSVSEGGYNLYSEFIKGKPYEMEIQGMSDRSTFYGDLANVVFNTTYHKKLGDERYKQFVNSLDIPDLPRGFIDDVAFYGGKFLGEMIVFPVGGKTKQAVDATVDYGKRKLIDDLVEQVNAGDRTLKSITDQGLGKSVKEAVMAATVGSKPASDISVSMQKLIFDTVKETGRRGAGHIKMASNAALGGGMAATIAENSLTRWYGFSQEEAEDYAYFAGIVGMLTGASGLTKTPINLLKSIPGLGSLPVYLKNALFRHYYKVNGNYIKEQEYTLRLASATKEEARMFTSENPEVAKKWMYDNINKSSIDDAVTLVAMIEKMAKKDPKFSAWVLKAKQRQEKLHNKFQDVFLVEGAVKRDDLRRSFVDNMTKMFPKKYSKAEIQTYVTDLDLTDFPMFVDQLFMLDMLTGLRNSTMKSVSLGTLNRKESIDLITQSQKYSNDISQQIDVLQAALASFAPLKKSPATKDFFDAVTDRVNVAVETTQKAQERVKQLVEDKIAGNGAMLNDLIRTDMEKSFLINKHGKQKYLDPDIAERYAQKGIKVFENQRKEKFKEMEEMYDNLNFGRIEVDVSPLLNNLGDVLQDKAIQQSLDLFTSTGKDFVLKGASAFRFSSRKKGLMRKFQANTWGIPETSFEELIETAQDLNDDIVSAHKQIHQIDASVLGKNKTPNYALMDETPVLQKTMDDLFEKIDSGEIGLDRAKETLIQKMNSEITNFSRLESVSKEGFEFIQRKQIDSVIDSVANPTASAQELHNVLKAVNRTINATKDRTTKNKLLDFKQKFSDEFRSITDERKIFVEGNKKTSTAFQALVKANTRYRDEYAGVYYNGLGDRFKKFTKQEGTDPEPLEKIFNMFVTSKDPLKSKREFNKLFPVGSKGREEAVEQLRYSIGRVLLDGKDGVPNGFRSIAGGQPVQFIKAYKDILGKENVRVFNKWYNHESVVMKQIKKIDEKDTKTLQNGLQQIVKTNQDIFRGTAFARIAYKDQITFEDVSELLSDNTVTRKLATPEGQKYPIQKAKEDILEIVPTKEFELRSKTPKKVRKEIEKELDKSSLPIEGSKDINVHVIDMFLEDPILGKNENFKKVLKSVITHKFIDNSFGVTGTKRFREMKDSVGNFDLTPDFSIANFSNMWKENVISMKKLFDPEEFDMLSDLFEFSISTQGDNIAASISNLTKPASTTSIASRMFAFQRKIVGLPYIIAENTVLTFQRDKAAFLKRLVMDKDVSRLLHDLSVKGDFSKKNITAYKKYLQRVYGGSVEALDKISDEDLKEKLKAEWILSGGQKAQQGFDIDRFKKKFNLTSTQLNNIKNNYGNQLSDSFKQQMVPIVRGVAAQAVWNPLVYVPANIASGIGEGIASSIDALFSVLPGIDQIDEDDDIENKIRRQELEKNLKEASKKENERVRQIFLDRQKGISSDARKEIDLFK